MALTNENQFIDGLYNPEKRKFIEIIVLDINLPMNHLTIRILLVIIEYINEQSMKKVILFILLWLFKTSYSKNSEASMNIPIENRFIFW